MKLPTDVPNKLPANLMLVSWINMPAAIFQSYRQAVLLGLLGVGSLAGIAGLLAFAISGEQRQLFLVIPVGTWLVALLFLLMYGLLTREVMVLRPGPTGKYILDQQKWFKNAKHEFKASDCHYVNGRRVLWLIWNGDKYIPFEPFSYRQPTSKSVTAAQVSGIEGYRDSVRSYSLRKSMTMIEQLRLGMVVVAMVVLLLGIYIMSGRLRNDDTNTRPVPASAEVEWRAEDAVDGRDRSVRAEGLR